MDARVEMPVTQENVQVVAKPRQAKSNLSVHGVLGDAQPAGDFPMRKTVYLSQRDHLPTSIRQRLDRINKEGDFLFMTGRLGRIWAIL